jgi:hypothetical protein
MHRCLRMFQFFALALFAFTPAAFAQDTSQMPPVDTAGATPDATAAGEQGSAAAEGAPAAGAVAAPLTAPRNDAKYGLAFRVRWVSIPSWFLGVFTEKNVPLSTYSYALEGYRRKADRDDPNRTWELSVAIGFQNMSPSDGYWLGKGKQIEIDTDLVQARNFSLITMDAAFVSRQYFSRYFGIHYGAGLGLGVVRGKILRTSAVCDKATGQCHVQITQAGQACGGPGQAVCTEANLAASQGPGDQAGNGHRFQETTIPGAIPIINLLFGLDFPIPDAKGLEFRLEGGFYDAFFLGGTAGYVF